MALSPGTRLGSYEVTALIGQGGMGEVYRASDTKLNRSEAGDGGLDSVVRGYPSGTCAGHRLNLTAPSVIVEVAQIEGFFFSALARA